MAGTGKRTKLVEALGAVAAARSVPFTIQMRPLEMESAGDITAAGASEDGAGPGDNENAFLFEYSLVHIGLDIARMSMQDKQVLRPVLAKLGQGSQVMAGDQGRGHRILVLYHAHLLSSESVLLIQACLEQNEGDLSIWMTSELPVPQRIRDWFVEIPVAGEDYALATCKGPTGTCAEAVAVAVSWPDIFREIIDKWRRSPAPTIGTLAEVKSYIYEMLMRNLRWVEATHFLLDTLLGHPDLTEEERGAALAALAACEATAGGYTIPSYRIPILWESLFLKLRCIFKAAPVSTGSPLSDPQVDGVTTTTPRARRISKPRKTGVGPATPRVATISGDGAGVATG